MGSPFIGEIRLVGCNFAILGWAFCAGQQVAIDQLPALFQVIGTTYGGDGTAFFALPDFQGRIPIHRGTGPGLTPRSVGQKGGSSTVTLTTAQMPPHQHMLVAASGSGTSNDPKGNLLAAPAKGGSLYGVSPPGGTGPSVTTLNAQAIGSTGGGAPHNNMQPYLAVTFLIALEGAFPNPR